MNERSQYRILTVISFFIIAFSSVVFFSGFFLYINIARLGDELPVETVDQFRNISNIMPLILELSSNLDEIQTDKQILSWKRLGYTISKIKIAEDLITSDFNNQLPYDLKVIMDELSQLGIEISISIDSTTMLDSSNTILLKNRIDYIYSEFNDYIIRINNDTLTVLSTQKTVIGNLKTMILSSSLIAIGAAALTIVLLRNRKKLFSQLKKSREAAIAQSKAKSEFLSNMSHEIRTPMNAIIGLSYLALKTTLTPSQRNYLKQIQISGQHLLGVINDILDFSKIEAGKLSIEHIPFEIEKVLDNVANLTAEKASEKGLELIFEIDKNVPNHLIGDPLRIGQILINYTNNAVKFTEKGEIGVRIKVSTESEKDVLLYFEVNDTGIGIPDTQKELLFQSFQQADSSITRRYGGSGLGLAISKTLVEMLGGEVGLESTAGKGSTFWFTARLGKSEKERRSYIPRIDLRGRRVLVVDDNKHARAVIQDLLQSMTFDTTAVESGYSAIEELKRTAEQKEKYSLLFIDWQMPGMDGIETVKKIKAMELTEAPHIVIITAYGREEIIRAAEDTGIENVLIKPVSASVLFDTAMHILGANKSEQRELAVTVMDDSDKGLNGIRILLVEDNKINQSIASEILESAGCLVSIAEDGAQAVSMVQKTEYDLILMDIQMPVMDGLTATQRIRELPQSADIPIIAMTANAMMEDKERCIDAGMNDYLAKPIDPDAMFSKLQKYYSNNERLVSPLPPADSLSEAAGIPDIPGINIKTGLHRVMGNETVYMDLLRRFTESQGNVVEEIRNSLSKEENELAERLAHTLKGVSGNISAEEVQALAGEIETAIRTRQPGEVLKEMLERLSSVLTTLMDNIGRIIVKKDTAQTIPGNIETLMNYVKENDSEALDYFDSMTKELSALYSREDFKKLEASLRAYDFSSALEIIKRRYYG